MTQAKDTIALQSALENASQELERLAQKALAIDEAMGDAIAEADALEALPLELTQDVDLMRQSADCLHVLLSNLAALTAASSRSPEQVEVEVEAVTQGVYLSAIRNRIATPAPVTPVKVEETEDWIDL